MVKSVGVLLSAVVLAGCGAARVPVPPAAPLPAPVVLAPAGDEEHARTNCAYCEGSTLDGVLLARSTERVAELKGLGGDCAVYGSVLETSVTEGRVRIRPYMWRVGRKLVSGEATPEGNIVVAREIDPLNHGIRTVEDVLWTLEHEAAHLAFRISNLDDALADGTNARLRECRHGLASR